MGSFFSSPQQKFNFLPLGAIIQQFNVEGRNIVLSFPSQDDYINHGDPHFGETIGRVANRLKDAVINLNGQKYHLDKNDGENCIHGGCKGWGQRMFSGPMKEKRGGKDALKFTYLSPDGDSKFPGPVELRVWYIEAQETETTGSGKITKDVLTIEYEVVFAAHEDSTVNETAMNVTNHSYFNLGGGSTIAGTKARLTSRKYLPVDASGIPLGSISDYPLDVSQQFDLGSSEPKIDSCFVVETNPAKVRLDTRQDTLNLLGSFSHATSNIHLEVYSTEPAFQFYTGDHIDQKTTPGYGPRAGFCVEPGRFTNAVNQPEWRSMSLLRKGQTYGSKVVYKAWKN